MTGPGTNVTQACAACKHQRRKCAPDCVLAPYFPPHRHTEFLNVHKLFGIKNVINTVKSVDPSERETAVRSMIHEASLRVMDPVSGSCGLVKNYVEMCDQMKAELDIVRQQLVICRKAHDKGEIKSKVRSFYENLMPQNPGNVALDSHSVDKSSDISPRRDNNDQISGKTSSSGKDDGVETLRIGPYEKNGAIKMRNIDTNNESPAEMEENDSENSVPLSLKM